MLADPQHKSRDCGGKLARERAREFRRENSKRLFLTEALERE
jgi:hypothetical protein